MKTIMKAITLGEIVVLAAFTGCSGVGDSVYPTVGVNRIFAVNESEANLAITNSFRNGQYNDMLLGPAVGSGELVRGWHPTNGFVLFPGTGTRYYAYFYIVTAPLATNQTRVTVRTIEADVVDGKEPGVHGGWALHFKTIRPDQHEEENVMAAIDKELNSTRQP